MRKTITLLIAFLALTVSSWATVTQQQIGDFWYELDDSYNVATLIKLPGSDDWASYDLSGDITIPGTVNDGVSDYTVTTIGSKAFVNVGITSVTIEEGVTDINELAFYGSSLQSATLPSTITYLGNQSFDYTALTAFVITATSPASFGYGDPFSNVSTLEHIYVPAASVDAYKTAWSNYASLIEEKPVWITWYQTDVESVNLIAISEGDSYSQTVKNIEVTASSPESGDYATFSTGEYGNSISIHDGGTITFAPTSGKLTGISISCGGYASYSHLAAGSGWTWNNSKYALEWSGEPATSVVLACDGSSDGIYFGQNTSIVFTLEAEEEPAPVVTITTVTWDSEEVSSISLSCENVDDVQTTSAIDGIIASLRRINTGGNCSFNNRDLWMTNDCGEITFTSSVGNISGIVITSDNIYTSPYDLPAGWTYDSEATTLTWAGAASSQVTLSGNMDFNVYSVEFTVESAAAPVDPTPANQEPVTWDFVNDEELANIYLSQYTHYNFGGYYQEYYDDHYSETVKNFKGVVATISAMTDGSYATFNNNNNYCIDLENGGTLTFSTELGQFQSIVINTTGYGSGSGEWAWDIEEHTLTWAGTPANSVVLDNVDIDNITSIVFTFVSAAPAFTADITWDATEVATISLYGSSFNTVVPGTEIDGITPSIMKTNDGYCYFDNSAIKMQNNGELIFTSSVGDIQGIVLTFDNTDSYSISDFPVGWTLNETAGTLTWEGTASDEVSLSGNISCTVTSIEFDVDPSTAPADPSIPTGPSFIWQSRQVSHVLLSIEENGDSQTTHVIKNVITSLQRTAAKADEYDFCLFANKGININNNGTLTFQSIVGDLTGIIITCGTVFDADDLSEGWRYDSENGTLIWMGTPAETVSLSGNVDVANISSIEFFYDPAPAPRKGETFFGIYNQYYQITGAHTAKMPAQDLNHTLSIPEYVDYEDVRYFVTEIADYAFYGQAELPNVMRGVNIAKIGAHAFDGCIQITDISLLSDVLDTIGDAAFKNCKLMSNFDNYTELPPVLGSNAFSGNTYLNRIRVNSSYTVDAYKVATNWSEYADKIVTLWENPAIGEQFFWSNQMTTNWYAVSSVSPVKEAKVLPYSAALSAIYPRTLVGRLVIPEEISYLYLEYKVTGIGANAYKDSTRFYMVIIPQAVKSIESGAFLNCTGVENVQFLWDDPTEVTWADATVGAEFKTAASGETRICVPKGTLAAYQAWAPAWASCMVEGEVLDIDVSASEDPNHVGRYYRTFYDSETDYLMPPSVWAHAGYVDGESFVLRPVAFDGMVLPRGTAVVLESETPTYRLVPVGNTAPLYDGENDLIGTDVAFPRADLGADAERVYVLGKKATVGTELKVGMGMYRYVGTNLGAHKAYMILDSSTPNPAPRYLFKHENQAEGVENVQDSASCNKILRDGQLIIVKGDREYNAQGQIIK